MKTQKLIHLFGAASLAMALLASVSTTAQAAGYYIQEQSPRLQGMAFAGAVAHAADASTIFYNPAGMTRLDRAQGQVGMSLIVPRAQYRDRGTTITTGASGGPVAPGGGNGPDPFDLTPVPSAYVAAPMSDNVWFGVGVSAPFGLSNDYGRTWVGRYDSTQSHLMTVDVAPSFAWRVNDRLSLGIGVDVQYARAMLDNAIPDTFDATPDPTTDGFARLQGSDVSTSFNAGLLYDVTEDTTIGLHYRSSTKHTLEGEVIQVAPVGSGGATTVLAATADLELPQIVTLGFAHDLNDQWSIYGHGSWFGWNSFNEIRVEFVLPLPDSVTEQLYDNSYAVALGAEYKYDEKWTFRGGVQYDQTPTVANFRTSRTPDADRYWLSLGATYEYDENLTLDVAATHIFMDDADISLARTPAGTTLAMTGEVEGSIDIFSANLNWKF